ncbi:MAG: SDR family oxidoreductase [Tenericutes bacterium]|nr:SDR family oxidoreductase [Mycoplasmatota bacterium]
MYTLITGASSGLGKELAYIFAENNFNLVLVARRKELLDKLKVDLELKGIQVKVVVADLTDVLSCFELFDSVKDLDITYLINNAGFGNLGYFNDTNLNIELEMIDLNIKTVHILTKLFINNFVEGTIVNIGSLAGYIPTPIHATYSSTKSYVNFFSRAVNYELKKQGKNVRVLTVAPGPIKTNFNQVAKASKSHGMETKKCARIIYKGIKKRKEFIIPGFSLNLIYFINRFIPTRMLMMFSHKIQSRK